MNLDDIINIIHYKPPYSQSYLISLFPSGVKLMLSNNDKTEYNYIPPLFRVYEYDRMNIEYLRVLSEIP